MQFINIALLAGLGLTVVPVVLHLLLRARPKPHLFPALWLLEARRRHNTRRLRLRHLWLLLLRMALIALLVLAIARPKLPAADYWPRWPDEILGLALLVAVPLAVYLLLVRSWRRRQMPGHQLATRRSLLRGITGLVAALLLCLWGGVLYVPRVAGEITNPSLGAARNDTPVAAVLVFDTSQSMEYRHQSLTRLEVAQQIARDHLARLPSGSRVAIIDTAVVRAVAGEAGGKKAAGALGIRYVMFQRSDSAMVARRLDQLEPVPVSRSLNSCLESGLLRMESERDRPRKEGETPFIYEVYVLTDMARGGWLLAAAEQQRLKDLVAARPWLGGVYIVDVGIEEPTNAGIAALRLSSQTVASGGAVTITATVDGVGLGTDALRTVDLSVFNAAGQPVPRGSAEVKLAGGSAGTATFVVDGLKGSFVQGEIRLRSSDPLKTDDVGYFTIGVAPAPEVLLVAPTAGEVAYLREALAPRQEAERGRARFRCTYLSSNRLGDAELSKYRTVLLINVEGPGETTWERLEAYVRGGGGLGVALGTSTHWKPGGISPVRYNTPAAQAVLPATLNVSSKYTPPEFLDLRSATHPALKLFADLGGAGDLATQAIRRYWKLDPVAGSQVVANFTGEAQSPALLERGLGQGRCLMFATALDLRQGGWNDLPRSDWFVVFADQFVGYLAQRTGESFTHEATTGLAVELIPPRPVTEFSVVLPDGSQQPGSSRTGQVLSIDATRALGHYRVNGLGDADKYHAGFSLNLDPRERDLSRLGEAELDGLFGADRYEVARDPEELERKVGDMRIGREVFPMMLMLLLLVFCLEHLVANRFYDTDGLPATRTLSGSAGREATGGAGG